ncbi:MAG TPA: RNA methyltransferase [Candidatus Dormibacteraeota bacterium]|jgi:23S rRNA (guanosine2251-2'-O)-methyltransferase|nr:RNA methyltransferase [Candidatus Dormibacteraeota bacterium]
MPVLQALRDPGVRVDKVIVAHNAEGGSLDAILEAAAAAGVRVHHASPQRIKMLAGNGRQDQGVVADIAAPRMLPLEEFLASPPPPPAHLLALDGVHTPGNVGMIVRTVAAAGLEGLILPRQGAPEVDPLVIKASAGTVFRAPLLRCRTPQEALERSRTAGFEVVGLDAGAEGSLYAAEMAERAVFVLGNETAGVSPDCRPLVDRWVSIPLSAEVDSLNVACAAAVLAFELVRRRQP